MECMRQLGRVPTNDQEAVEIQGGFLAEMQRQRIEQAPSDAIRALRVAAWRARELHHNELADGEGYLERASQCRERQRHLERRTRTTLDGSGSGSGGGNSSEQHCCAMAGLCAEEARACEGRAALSRELAGRALERGDMLERIQMNHEFWDYKAAEVRDAAASAAGDGTDAGSLAEQEEVRRHAEEDLKVRFDRELAREAEDVARAEQADLELEQGCMARDESRAELVRLYNIEKEARAAGLA
jgi:hypothetical protein